MLAIQPPQRPRMGSTQPSDPNLPFGYVDPTHEFFLPEPEPPEPAPGLPLLNDTETKTLSSFFDDISDNAYNLPSFGEGLNFSDAWLELPPQFMGTATSFGQSPAPPLTSPGHAIPQTDFFDLMSMGSSLMPPPPPPPQQQQQQQQQPSHPSLEQHHPADVLAAAQLLQNGSSSRSNTASSGAIFSSNRDASHSLGPPVGHLRHQPLEDFKRAERGNIAQANLIDDHDSTFSDMFFGPAPGERISAQRTSQAPIDVQFGSDNRFNCPSFVPDHKESFESLSKSQLRYMECLEPSQSTNNTRPPSPNGEQVKGHSRKSSEVLTKEEDADAPPRKRRKSKNTKDDVEEDEEESGPATKAARKRKTKTEPASATPPAENGTASRRRKSGTGAKPPRENLTEAQKRENHIKSEQKRRTLIKEGFDDLCDLVPGLKGGGFSKSTMLTMAAEWLEELLKGNDELRTQMNALEGR